MFRPQFWIVAGPNGAGKTTCVQKEPISHLLPNVTFFNPDDRTLTHSSTLARQFLRRSGYRAAAHENAVTLGIHCSDRKFDLPLFGVCQTAEGRTMSLVRNLVGFLIAIVGFAVGSVAFNYAWQFKTAAHVVEPEPESVKLANLVSTAPGTKVHLELTDFKFGEPLIEDEGGKWGTVWLPLISTAPATRQTPAKASAGKPTANKGKSPPVVYFRSTRIHDQAQLDEFREQKSLRVFVANTSLGKSVWGATISQDLYAKYPDLDFAKLTLVVEPDLEVPFSTQLTGKPVILSTELLIDPATKNIAWGISGVSLFLGMILVSMMISPNHRVVVTEPRCSVQKSETGVSVTARYISSVPARFAKTDDVQRQRAKLQIEHPVSTHHYNAIGMVKSVLAVGFGLLFFLCIFGALLFGSSQTRGSGPATACLLGFFAPIVFSIVVYFAKRSLDLSGKSVDMIQHCNSGLRWQRGKKVDMAVWSEITHVERITIDVNRKKQVMATQFGLVGALAASMGSAGEPENLTRDRDTVTIQLHTGDVMIFSKDSLSDYVHFATTIHEQHGSEARHAKGESGGGMIARAFMLPGARSKFTMQDYRK